ncbi:PLAC8 family domain containing protein [Rhypophila decipiens]
MGHDHEHIREGEWQTGLCDCCGGGHCCVGTFCPCLMVQKTQTWLSNPSDSNPSGCGTTCLAYTALQYTCGFGFCVEWGQRRAIRHKFGIKDGSKATDCLTPFCCPCCAAIQEFTEVERRRLIGANGVVKDGYVAPGGMTMGH